MYAHTSRTGRVCQLRRQCSVYCRGVARRSGLDGPPRSFLISGDWPEGKIEGPIEVRYAQELAQRLRSAVGASSLREVARAARIDHTTISAIMAGQRWADLVTIARLEDALEVRLWPDMHS